MTFLVPARALALLTVSSFAAGCGDEPLPPPTDGRPVVSVQVGATGYDPAVVTGEAGKPLRLVFRRTTDKGCGQQLVIPAEKIQRDLPLDQPVAVDVTVPSSGKLAFTCGMGHYDGAVVAQ
jgi:plastocyanin domain-containing protein